MTTLIIGSGQQTLNLQSTGPYYDEYDANANSPFFLADYLDFVANNRPDSHVSAYPIRFYANRPWIWNGGLLRGNIPEATDWSTWYLSSADNFNSAGFFPRSNQPGTINDFVIGIEGNLSSFPADGLRLNIAGNIDINDPRCFGCRDDWIEADGSNGRTRTIRRAFLENLFVLVSATGVCSNSLFRFEDSLTHFRRWPYQGSLVHGPFLKVDNPTNSPRFEFHNCVWVIDYRNSIGTNGRTKSALARTTATGNSRVLVLNGTHQDRALITAFQNAGFSVLEDGSGSAATAEWTDRRAAFLSGGSVTPPPPPTFIPPITLKMNGAP